LKAGRAGYLSLFPASILNRGGGHMCSNKIHLAFLIGIIVHLFVALSPSYAENESFKHVNANHAVEISNTRLFFITSKHGFIHRTQSKSPLWNKPPAEIGSSSKTHSIYYIYNVAAKNSHKAHNVVYVPK
jgi:hypothetical protein